MRALFSGTLYSGILSLCLNRTDGYGLPSIRRVLTWLQVCDGSSWTVSLRQPYGRAWFPLRRPSHL